MIVGGVQPTNEDVRKSIMNCRWFPIPYPARIMIMQAPMSLRSGVAQVILIGVLDWFLKYVALTFFP